MNELPTVYIQDGDGNETVLTVTEPDPADGTFCAHYPAKDHRHDPGWVRIVPNGSRAKLLRLVTEYDEGNDPNMEDNLREMDSGDIKAQYGMTDYDAGLMVAVVSETTDPKWNTYGVKEEDAKLYLEQLQESIHQSFEGFSVEDRVVIRAYLADIAYAASICKEDRSGLYDDEGNRKDQENLQEIEYPIDRNES